MSNETRQPKGVPAGGEFATTAHTETGTTLGRPHAHETPKEVDEQLAALYGEYAKARQRVHGHVGHAHYLLGHRKSYARGAQHDGWPTSGVETLQDLQTGIEDGTVASYNTSQARRLLEDVATLNERAGQITTEMGELEAEHVARGRWSRFFLVTSSAGGHIHSSRSCHTCKLRTTFGWLPSLSGKDEATAVADQGAILCTACYPSAPVEWTQGKPEAEDTCPGSNQKSATEPRFLGRSRYGTCGVCAEMLTVGYGGIRKHKTPKPKG